MPILNGSARHVLSSSIQLVGFGRSFRHSLKHFGFTLFSEFLDLIQIKARFSERFFEKFIHALSAEFFFLFFSSEEKATPPKFALLRRISITSDSETLD